MDRKPKAKRKSTLPYARILALLPVSDHGYVARVSLHGLVDML